MVFFIKNNLLVCTLQGLCSKLENRQFTLDTVNKKVEAVLADLTPKDREEMEQSIKSLSTEHNRVYSIAVEQKNMLTEALNAREVFQVGLDRVNLWLDDREMKISKLEKHKLTANDVEKQMEKAKVRTRNVCHVSLKYRHLDRGWFLVVDEDLGMS